MKKRYFVLLSLMFVIMPLFLCSCNINPNAAKIVGDWKIETMSINGETVKPGDNQKDAISFTFNRDGTGKIKGDGASVDMKWTLENDTVSFGDDKTTIKGTLKDDKLYVDQYGGAANLVMVRDETK